MLVSGQKTCITAPVRGRSGQPTQRSVAVQKVAGLNSVLDMTRSDDNSGLVSSNRSKPQRSQCRHGSDGRQCGAVSVKREAVAVRQGACAVQSTRNQQSA